MQEFAQAMVLLYVLGKEQVDFPVPENGMEAITSGFAQEDPTWALRLIL